MQGEILCKISTSDLLAALSFIVSLVSMWVSYKTYRRDEGSLVISVKLGELFNPGQLNHKRDGIFFRISNPGRRLITIADAYCELDGSLKRMRIQILLKLSQFIPKRIFQRLIGRRHIARLFPSVASGFLYLSTGKFLTLNEGDVTDQVAYFPEADGMAKVFAFETKKFIVTDTAGKQYCLPHRALQNFRFEYQRRLEELLLQKPVD
jgi:hypothetical protein